MSTFSCCGTECSSCGCYGTMCNGCNEIKGMVFHSEKWKACAIYECAINNHKYGDCSAFGEVPCSIWRNTRDHKFTDEEFEKNINQRMENLRSKW